MQSVPGGIAGQMQVVSGTAREYKNEGNQRMKMWSNTDVSDFGFKNATKQSKKWSKATKAEKKTKKKL